MSEGVIIGDYVLNKLPILCAGPPTITHTSRLYVPGSYGQMNKFRAEALINQQSKCHAVASLTTRRTRGVIVGFASAKRRGRPRRGCTSA